jgi:hypothetical protein
MTTMPLDALQLGDLAPVRCAAAAGSTDRYGAEGINVVAASGIEAVAPTGIWVVARTGIDAVGSGEIGC